jgi:F0F1-type ATP synthase membrane subunit b/b'
MSAVQPVQDATVLARQAAKAEDAMARVRANAWRRVPSRVPSRDRELREARSEARREERRRVLRLIETADVPATPDVRKALAWLRERVAR